MAKKTDELGHLMPNSTTIKTDDGKLIRVAGNAQECKIHNWLLAAQVRSFLESSIKKYEDSGDTPTPKDLRDLVAAAKDLAEFSAVVYKDEPASPRSPVQVPDASIPVPDFNKITKPDEPIPGQADSRPDSP